MAIQNLILVLKNLCVVGTAKRGCDTAAGVLGQRMPAALSQGRSMSPGFAWFESYPVAHAIRIGRSAANLPGKPVQTRDWCPSDAWVTQIWTGCSASPTGMTGRALSPWCKRHHSPSGHDYPSHDRRDDRQRNRVGLARTLNRGK